MKMIRLRSVLPVYPASLIAGPVMAAIPMAPGYANDFTTAPPSPADFSTLSIGSAAGDIGNDAQMDAAVQALTAASISTALGTSSTYPPSTDAFARHNTNASGLFLQTRPTGNGATLLMAAVTNNSTGPVGSLTISYNLGRLDLATGPAIRVEQIDGHRFYYSTTGAAGSWNALGNYTNPTLATQAALTINLTFSTPIAPGGMVYLLWADDNAASVTDNSFTIDNLRIASDAERFIAKGAVWKYLDTGSYPGAAWTGASFDDSAWASGPAELGYGDSPVTTVSYGPDPANKFVTTWFRKTFNVADASAVPALAMGLKRDDGAVIYLNGAEVARSNMPAGAFTSSTFAASNVGGANEEAFFPINLSSGPLVNGTNVIAVEIHQDDAASSDVSFDLELFPVALPELLLTRGPYLQQAAPTSMVIRWRTNLAVTGRVNIGPSAGVISQTFDETAPATEHVVKLTGLAPDTTYYYSVGTPDGTLAGGDATHVFTTPPAAGTVKNTRVWVLGDAGTKDTNQRNVRDAFYTFTGSRVPDLCLLLGDNAYNDGTDAEFQAAIFDTYPTMLRRSPFWSCLGNHETYTAAPYPYFDIFTFPENGEAGGVASGTEHYFSFDYGNIHFISLDSMTASRAPGGDMAIWLASDLASTTATWIIAFFHHPPYTKGSHNSDSLTDSGGAMVEMRQNILPILENGGVDLVLSGHSHCYERSFLLDGHYGFSGTLVPSMKKNAGDGRESGNGAYIKPLTGPRDHFGAVYNVAGSAGQATTGTMNHPAMFFSVLELGSVVLDINGNRLDSTFLRDNGTIRDTYTILKQGAADSDNDGMPDAYEISNGLNRHDPADAALDQDGDGTSNLNEFIFGRQASTADLYNFTTSVDSIAGTATVSFPTVTGRTYRVDWSETLLASDWHPGSPVISGTGSDATWTDNGPLAPRRFYRIVATAGP